MHRSKETFFLMLIRLNKPDFLKYVQKRIGKAAFLMSFRYKLIHNYP